MKRIIIGAILFVGGLVWDFINPIGAIVILQIAIIVVGFTLVVLGVRHLWIARR